MTIAPANLKTASSTPLDDVSQTVARARLAQAMWGATPLRDRLRVLKRLRHAIAESSDAIVQSIAVPNRRTAETIVAEVLPLAAAIKFLEREAMQVLRPKRFGRRGRALWLGRLDLEIRRDPLGIVLIVAPSNYPLLLSGVQAVQALTAGNAVLVKPAPGHAGPMQTLLRLALSAGLPRDLLAVLPEEPASVSVAVEAGIDKLLLTGSAETGARVLELLAQHLVPSTMELSGSDAVFVCPDADIELFARALAFGLALNGGATCIAPRRIFLPRDLATQVESRLIHHVSSQPALVPPRMLARLNRLLRQAVADGARMVCGGIDEATGTVRPIVLADARPEMALLKEDVFAPVTSIVQVDNIDDAIGLAAQCPFRLGASVFGSPDEAQKLASRIDAGSVAINDLVAPTADPRLPFGGRGRSGFGVTRGAEGLLEMTQIKAISTRRGGPYPHLLPADPTDAALFTHYLAMAHGSQVGKRIKAAWQTIRLAMRRGKSNQL